MITVLLIGNLGTHNAVKHGCWWLGSPVSNNTAIGRTSLELQASVSTTQLFIGSKETEK